MAHRDPTGASRRRVFVALGVAVCVGLSWSLAGSVGAGATTSVTRAEAAAIAMKALRPGKGTVVFALQQPIAAKQLVGEGVSGPVKPAGRRAWLFWHDQAPFALFRHPSRLLLVDAATGKVIRDQRLGWWPVLGRKLLPFSPGRAGYLQKRYRVHPAPRSTAARAPSASRASAPAFSLPPGSFTGDCLVTVGAREDPVVGGNFPAWEKWAKTRGIKTFQTDPGADGTAPIQPPTVGDLGVTIGKAVKAKCTDVLILLSGHGSEPPEGERDAFADGGSFTGTYEGVGAAGLPTVSTVSAGVVFTGPGETPVDPDITSKDLRELIVSTATERRSATRGSRSCSTSRGASTRRRAT